jgi:hypothetical protein
MITATWRGMAADSGTCRVELEKIAIRQEISG